MKWAGVLLALTVASAWAQQADKDGVYFASRGVTSPKLIRAVPTAYPTEAGAAGVEGSCTISLVVGADGSSSGYQVAHSMGGAYDSAALQAVRQSQFEPGNHGGQRVPIYVDVWIPFHADKSPSTLEMLPLKRVDHAAVVIHAVDVNVSGSGGKAKYQGLAGISVLVTEDGLPFAPHVVLPLGMGLDEKALQAVAQYRFKPATRDGKPVPSRMIVEVNCRLY